MARPVRSASGALYVPPPSAVPWLRPLASLAVRLFPYPCLGCAAPLPLPAPPLGLCRRCHDRLTPPLDPACRRCARPLAGARGRAAPMCPRCAAEPPPLDALLYAYCYDEPATSVMRALKFGGADFLGRDLAAALARRHGELLGACQVVVPVPLSWPRLLRRGYNQAEAIAAPLSELLGRPCRRLLRRRHRRRQTTLGRRRRLANPRLAFGCRRPLAGLSILLVDDVVTTGATLAAAAAALKEAGAPRVVGAVAARTPERR